MSSFIQFIVIRAFLFRATWIQRVRFFINYFLLLRISSCVLRLRFSFNFLSIFLFNGTKERERERKEEITGTTNCLHNSKDILRQFNASNEFKIPNMKTLQILFSLSPSLQNPKTNFFSSSISSTMNALRWRRFIKHENGVGSVNLRLS